MVKISSEYNADRAILAMRCADALGIKPVSPVIYEFAVKNSELPMEDSKYSRSFPESSLLSMGVVYSYGQTAKFIDQSGHTCIVPYNEVILEELIVYASMHPVLSNNYFSETGLYNYFCLESSTKTSNMY